MGDIAPAYQGHVLHFDALRLVALCKEGRTEETLTAENEREVRTQNLRTYTQLLMISADVIQLSVPLPARPAKWHGGPCLASCSMYWGVIPDLT